MEKLNFEEGIKEFAINDDEARLVKFNPSDVGFIDRFWNAYEAIMKKAENLKDKEIKIDVNGDADDFEESAKLVSDVNKSMRSIINDLFGYDCAGIIFGIQNPLSMAGKKTLIENFLDALTPVVKDGQERNTQRAAEYKDAYDRFTTERTLN